MTRDQLIQKAIDLKSNGFDADTKGWEVELGEAILLLHSEQKKDEAGMRDMQAKFIAADQELRRLRDRLARRVVVK